MGTKRPMRTLFDTLSHPNTAERRPGSREPSPRPGTTAQTERDRERNREEERRRERETERMRDKMRNRPTDVDPRDRYPEKDRPPRAKEREKEWADRERRREAERRPNGRPTSNLVVGNEREMDQGRKKGDTFPRMVKHSKEEDARMHTITDRDMERWRLTESQKGPEMEDLERERERARRRERQGDEERYRDREREAARKRANDGTTWQRERPREPDPVYRERRRERDSEGNDLWSRRDREKDTGRDRLRPRQSGSRERKARMPSPQKRRERDEYRDRNSRDQAERRGARRDTRSEGDSDEERKRERLEDREREELRFRHCRSEGDSGGKVAKDKETRGYREEERQRYRERDRERETDGRRMRDEGWEKGGRHDKERSRERDRRKEAERERERQRGVEWERQDRTEDRREQRDRREGDRVRVREEERRFRERRDRETEGREGVIAGGRGGQPQSERPPRAAPRAQSSGEWSSDMDCERRNRGSRDSREERESGRESTAESERDAEQDRESERRGGRHKRAERADRDRMTGRQDQKRMWLEPQRGTNQKDTSSDDRHAGWKGDRGEGEERRLEAERRRDGQREVSGRHQSEAERQEWRWEEAEGVSVDGEEVSQAWRGRDKGREDSLPDSDEGVERSWPRDRERGDNMTDNTEESDREEEGGSGSLTRSESEGGSEKGWKHKRTSMLSGEDGFITVSSGGEEEEEDEEEERDEEEFEDCREFWDSGVPHEASQHIAIRGREGERERQEEWTREKVSEEGDEGSEAEKKRKYVFCVIGQTLPRSKPNQRLELDSQEQQEICNPNSGSDQRGSDDITNEALSNFQSFPVKDDEYTTSSNQYTKRDECNRPKESVSHTDETRAVSETYRISSEREDVDKRDEMKGKVEHPYAEIGPIRRNSETEKLLLEWREKNKEYTEQREQQGEPSPINPYGEVGTRGSVSPTQPSPSDPDPGTMTPEEEVAFRIRMSRAWTTEEEAKRHSQAPHMKWAKTVVREILGSSQEHGVDDLQEVSQGDEEVDQPATVATVKGNEAKEDKEEEVTVGGGEMPVYAMVHKSRREDHNSGTVINEEDVEPLELEELRGRGPTQADMHADQLTAMHDPTLTDTDVHTDTFVDTKGVVVDNFTSPENTTDNPSSHFISEEVSNEEGSGVGVGVSKGNTQDEILLENETRREKEVELSVCNTLYKPSSCPSLICNQASDQHFSPNPSEKEGCRGQWEDGSGDKSEERQEKHFEEKEPEEVKHGGSGQGAEVVGSEEREGAERKVAGLLKSSCSFRDLGPEARIRRRGIRKTTERRKEEHLEQEEEEEDGEAEGVGRDRRTRIFTTPDDEDDPSQSWGELELRNVLDTIGRRRNSKFFNAAQLYQQYSEAAQNIEILRQSRSDATAQPASSPAPSPPPARRPLPPLPPVPHPHSLSHSSSITSVKSLPLPEPPKSERRPQSPRLSISLNQSPTLWQDLPGVRNSTELGDLTEEQRRLQEVRFEVVTSEASYCRSLDIVVEHFVKSKPLGALLTTQDRNWLFSRLADVRAISHSFLSKLEERVESNTIHFSVCDIIARHCQRFKMVYVPYLTNQSYQDSTYQRLMDENPGFKQVVAKLERSPVCQRLPLRSFLILPFQRITRLKLLVQNIVKRTAPGTEEEGQAIKALRLLEKLIQESNDSITQMKSIESLVSLSAKVDFECRTLPLISQSRRLVREGPVTELMDFSLKDTERTVYLHLFNDYLLLSLHKEGGRFTVIDHAPVADLRAENCRVKLHSLQKNLFRLHLSSKALLLRTDEQSDKLRWISAVSRPHPPIDFSAAQDFTQMQCIRAFVAQQPDELSLEKADIILVHQQSSDGWVEGTRLSDRHRGWMPESHLETITNSRVKERNLSDALKLTTATAAS